MKKSVIIKANFLIFLIIHSMFYISLLPIAYAQESQQRVCCEKTLDGESCRYTDMGNCDTGVRQNNVAAACDQVPYCRTGCCIIGEACYKNVGAANCDGEWTNSASCDIPQCKKECCVAAGECSYVTEGQCNAIASRFEGLETDFRSAGSEAECTAICSGEEQGCCSDTGCSYGAKSSCSGDFHSNEICSSIDACNCKPRDHKGCFDDDVYWFDSCGNREDIAEGCDYGSGMVCGEENNEFKCISVDCATTFDSENVGYDGVPRKNGESWCSYDGVTGSGLDLVGSRHYRHMCINGRELVEPCRDFRQEFCLQAGVAVDGNAFMEASCVENNWQECSTTCYSAKGIKDKGLYRLAVTKDKECCENPGRSCVWAGNENDGRCIPGVPPGFQFWVGEKQVKADSGEVCSTGNTECTVYWKKTLFGKGEPIANRQCLENEWVNAANAYCTSLGDCGAYFNFKGDFTDAGFIETAPGEITPMNFNEFSSTEFGLFAGSMDSSKIGGISEAFSTRNLGLLALGLALGYISLKLDDTNALHGDGYLSSLMPGFRSVFSNLLFKATGLFGVGSMGPGSLLSAGTYIAGPGGVEIMAETGIAAFDAGATINVAGLGVGSEVVTGTVAPAASTLATAAAVISWAAVIAAVVLIILAFLTKVVKKTYHVTCLPWQAPEGGGNCDQCDEQFKECTEYRCRSLGQLCKFIPENQGTDRPSCFNANPNDVNSPVIMPWPEALTENYNINELDQGYVISPDISAFRQLSFGIKTNEPSQCRYSLERTDSYDAMQLYFGDSYYSSEHKLAARPMNGQDYTYYIRCQDPSGNSNLVEYRIILTTEDIDLTPPLVEKTNIGEGMPVKHGSSEILAEISLNEPVEECRWSSIDEEFNAMANSFRCLDEQGMDNLVRCEAELPVSNGENKVYYRCKDISGNINQESGILSYAGTDSLEIVSMKPNGILYDTSSPVLEVATGKGASNGKAVCRFSGNDEGFANMVEFFETNSNSHKQNLENLQTGDYDYYVKCLDYAGNEAEGVIHFRIDKDTVSPALIHVYRTGTSMVIETDEASRCEYSENSFSFGNGIATGAAGRRHSFEAVNERYYVNCQDVYGNSMGEITVNT